MRHPPGVLTSRAMDERRIAHLDMDAFYVNVELARRPDLRGLPVVVAGSGPRAVVTTASYEARKFGVFSATPASRARRLCPDAVFLPPDFKLYRARSGEVMQVLRDEIELVEQVGLDEAYLELTGIEHWRSAARRVKAQVTARTGLGVLDRDRAQQARGEGRLGRRQAGRLPRPDGGRGARAVRRRLPRPDPRDRAEDGRAAAGEGRRAPGPPGAGPGGVAGTGVRRPPRPAPRAARAVRGRSRDRDRARAQVGIQGDDVRSRPERARRARAGPRPPGRAAQLPS